MNSPTPMPSRPPLQAAFDHARDGRLLVFLGAGVSTIAPTCLPTWLAVGDAVIAALHAELTAAPVTASAAIDRAIAAVRDWQAAGRMPPEFQAEIIAARLPDDYFRVLQCLDGREPNAVHLGVAALAKAGKVAAIITTNFDRATEAAFARLDAPLGVRSREAHFADLAGHLDAIGAPQTPCQLLKIHGSADDPATLIDTLAQRKRGFPGPTARVLRHLLRHYHWLFLGYSGADLDADPNYLFLRGDGPHAPGITWLLRPGEAPRATVRDLLAAYGERGHLAHGELPACLAPLFAACPAPPPAPVSYENESARRADVAASVRDHAREWAGHQGREWCGLILADLLTASAAPDLALEILRPLHATTAATHAACWPIAVALARALQRTGDFDAAFDICIDWSAKIDVRRPTPSHSALLLCHGELWRERGDLAAALAKFHLAYALDVARGDERGQALARANEAAIFALQGNFDEAHVQFRHALAIFETIGDERARARILNDAGAVQEMRGESAAAVECFSDALAINERLGDEIARGHTLGNFAGILMARGDHDAAHRCLSDAHEIFARLGDDSARGVVLMSLGALATRQRDFAAAEHAYREALAIAARIGHSPARAQCLNNLGELARKQHDWPAAAAHLAESLALWEQIGDRHEAGQTAYNLALATDSHRGPQAGLMFAMRALAHFRAANAPADIEKAERLIARLGTE